MCSGLAHSDAAFDPEGVSVGSELEPEEGPGELDGVNSMVVTHLEADTGSLMVLLFSWLYKAWNYRSFPSNVHTAHRLFSLLLHFGVCLIKVSLSSESSLFI